MISSGHNSVNLSDEKPAETRENTEIGHLSHREGAEQVVESSSEPEW